MSTANDPDAITSVKRRQKDGTHIAIPCPESTKSYNINMGAVDTGDQLRGYYRCRTKFRKFYMYVYTFLKDVVITNGFILHKHCVPTSGIKTIKQFRMELAR